MSRECKAGAFRFERDRLAHELAVFLFQFADGNSGCWNTSRSVAL